MKKLKRPSSRPKVRHQQDFHERGRANDRGVDRQRANMVLDLRRRHSAIGYLSPIDYEHWHQATPSDPDARQPAAVLAAVKNGPRAGPFLTAAARDRRTIVRAGTEEWLRRGPNQRKPRNWRTKWRSIQMS